MFDHKRIAIGFTSIVLLVIGLASKSIIQLASIAKDMDQLYQHPFSVSNAAKSINFHLVSMHRHMKDVVLAQNSQELNYAVQQVNSHELSAQKNFDIIFERYLGDKSDINSAYRLFITWKPIRDEVIQLIQHNNVQAASKITFDKGAKHVGKLNLQVDKFVNFAFNKAESLHARAQKNEQHALIGSIVLSFLVIVLVTGFLVYLWRNLIKVQKDKAHKNHLIDQHIMIATLDLEANIIEASNALCRFLGCTQKDLIGQPSHFFDNSVDALEQELAIFQVIKTGKRWRGEIQHQIDDHISWASSSIIPNNDENYKLIGFTNILTDVTNKKLSIEDQLTTLLNRRRYDEIITKEMKLAQRQNYNLTLAIIDIDFFKKYNDLYGHPNGDIALTKVAQTLKTAMHRPNDYAFRIGGEEFALLFSETNKEDSEIFLNKIRKEIEALHISHADNKVCEWLTISIGAQVIHSNNQLTPEQAYILADKALYNAKDKRNRVVINE